MPSQFAQAVDYSSSSLADLAWLVKQGDHEAFRHIVQHCNQRLFRIARTVLNDDDEAEDALQDAYVSAFRGIDTFRGDAELSTWLARIVLNECYRRLRARRPSVAIEQLDYEQASGCVLTFPTGSAMATDPYHDATRLQMRELIEDAVAELPEVFRVVLVLRDIDGYSVREAAAILGVPAETVKTRLFRARHRLRAALRHTLSTSLCELFPFLGRRCQRLTDVVMRRIDTLTRTCSGDQ